MQLMIHLPDWSIVRKTIGNSEKHATTRKNTKEVHIHGMQEREMAITETTVPLMSFISSTNSSQVLK